MLKKSIIRAGGPTCAGVVIQERGEQPLHHVGPAPIDCEGLGVWGLVDDEPKGLVGCGVVVYALDSVQVVVQDRFCEFHRQTCIVVGLGYACCDSIGNSPVEKVVNDFHLCAVCVRIYCWDNDIR